MKVEFTGNLPPAQQLAAEEMAATLSADLTAIDEMFGEVGMLGITLEQMLDLVRVLTSFAHQPDRAVALKLQDSYIEHMAEVVLSIEGMTKNPNLRRAIQRAQAAKKKAYDIVENSEHEALALDAIRRAGS